MLNNQEIEKKENRLRGLLKEEKLDGILISNQNNFAWLTVGGDNHVVIASESGVCSALITARQKYIIADNIETGRIMKEEVKDQGFLIRSFNWWQQEQKPGIIKKICPDISKVGSDDGFAQTKNISVKISKLRYSLTEEEIKRYRWLGRRTSAALGRVCSNLQVGMTEYEIAGRLAEELLSQAITPAVLLVAADSRIANYRHPIPTAKKVKKYVMVVVCARRWGLIVSLTRLVHFGKINPVLARKHRAVVTVDAAFILNTIPGAVVGDIFRKAVEVYKETGFEKEWRLHHQGGPTGYAGRDYKATASERQEVLPSQAFAWNPSITGTKSEDTIITVSQDKLSISRGSDKLPRGISTKIGLASGLRPGIITDTPNWPMLTVSYHGQSIKRPDILVL